jgi:hypothetical protein
MNETNWLLEPDECVTVLVDFQAELAFGVESTARQIPLAMLLPEWNYAAIFQRVTCDRGPQLAA